MPPNGELRSRRSKQNAEESEAVASDDGFKKVDMKELKESEIVIDGGVYDIKGKYLYNDEENSSRMSDIMEARIIYI